jgi:Ring finger domain
MLPRRGDHYDDNEFTPLSCISIIGTAARACCCCLPPRRRRGYSASPSTEQSLLNTNTTRQETAVTAGGPPLEATMAAAGTTSATTAPPHSETPSERQVLLSPKQKAIQSDTLTAQKRNAEQQMNLKEKLGKQEEIEEEDYELEDDSNVCPTCLEPFTVDNPRVVAKCGHQYHLPCIYEWLERSPSCPMCGKKMEIEELAVGS